MIIEVDGGWSGNLAINIQGGVSRRSGGLNTLLLGAFYCCLLRNG